MSSQLPLCYCVLTLLLATICVKGDFTTQSGETLSTNSASISSSAPPDNKLHWLVQHGENPSGLMANGEPCSKFSFAGEQCTMIFVYQIKDASLTQVEQIYSADFGYGNSGDYHKEENTTIDGDSFKGFTITNATLKNSDGPIIAKFENYKVTSDLRKGIYTLSDPASGASVKIAWRTSLPQATTTPAPTTTQYQSTTTPGSTNPSSPQGPTESTTSPGTTPVPTNAQDCDDYTGKDRMDGIKSISIGGKQIKVYCEFGTSGALTTIQSRGEADNVSFSDIIGDYYSDFGNPGKGYSFWLGLDNMHSITSGNVSYNLYIDVCCGNNSIQQQRYHNFVIGSSPNYILNATADHPEIGLDIISVGGTGKSDIGAPFKTILTYNSTETNIEDCEALVHWNSNFTIVESLGAGGWWFGSCANNLNGKYIATESTKLDEQCGIKDFTSGTGVELRTSAGVIDPSEALWMDGKSYTRVRMAIFRNDVPLQGITPGAFCNGKS